MNPLSVVRAKTSIFWYPALFLFLLIFTLSIHFNGLYGQDSYEYTAYSIKLIDFFMKGINPGNYFWPLFYPLLGALFSIFLTPAFALQVISLASLFIAAIYLEKIILCLFKEAVLVRTYVSLFLILSPYVLRASMVVMADSLCVALILMAIYYFLLYYQSQKNSCFLLFIFCSFAAITTRYAAIALLILPMGFALSLFLKHLNLKVILYSLFIASLFLIPYILIAKINTAGFNHHPWLEGWSTTNFFKKEFNTLDGKASYSVFNVIYAFFSFIHPAYCFGSVAFLWFGRKYLLKTISGHFTFRIMLASLLFYSLFLAGIPFQNMRFLLLGFPLVLIVLFPGYQKLIKMIHTNKKRVLIGIVIFGIQVGLFYRTLKPFYQYNQMERQVSEEILKYSDNILIYTFSVDGALRFYGVKNPIINLWKVKLDTVPFVKPSLLLFNEKQFHQQWKDKNPMLNWDFIRARYKLNKLQDLPDHWELYETK